MPSIRSGLAGTTTAPRVPLHPRRLPVGRGPSAARRRDGRLHNLRRRRDRRGAALPRVHVADGNESEAGLRDVCDQLLNVVITGPRVPEKLGSAMTSHQAAPIPGAALRGAGMLSRESRLAVVVI